MLRSLSLIAALSAATQATALTCATPDPSWSYQLARSAPEEYVLLYGTLTADISGFPDPARPEPRPDPVPASFRGQALTPEGFTRDASGPVLLQPSCVEDRCGLPPGSGPVLAFARMTEAGPVIAIDPCPTWVFPDPPASTLDLMAACLRGLACGP